MKSHFILSILIFISILLYRCNLWNTNPEDIENYELSLSLEAITATSAQLSISFADSLGTVSFAIERNDAMILFFKSSNDTIINDINLHPDTQYRYRLHRLKKNKSVESTDPITVQTLGYNIHFDLDYTGPTFSSFRIQSNPIGKNVNIEIKREEISVYEAFFDGGDTLITDWSLKPSTQYDYRLILSSSDSVVYQSENITINTMGTTSHDFEWEVFKVCEDGGYIRAIEAVSENNVWAVGYYNTRIETPTGTRLPNVAKYDGYIWELQNIYNDAGLYDIHYFSDNSIWVSAGRPLYWDGLDWLLYHFVQLGVISNSEDHSFKHLWGSSSDDMYFMSEQGLIVHKSGDTFTKLDVPNYEYYRIDGIENPGDYGERVWIGGLGRVNDFSEDGQLLYFDGSEWHILWNTENQFLIKQQFFCNFGNQGSRPLPEC